MTTYCPLIFQAALAGQNDVAFPIKAEMRDRSFSHHGGWLRWVTPGTVVIFFALAMTASVLGVVVWKALEAKSTALERGKTDIQNLAHSLAEHASHTIQAADIAMTGWSTCSCIRSPCLNGSTNIWWRRSPRCRKFARSAC